MCDKQDGETSPIPADWPELEPGMRYCEHCAREGRKVVIGVGEACPDCGQ